MTNFGHSSDLTDDQIIERIKAIGAAPITAVDIYRAGYNAGFEDGDEIANAGIECL